MSKLDDVMVNRELSNVSKMLYSYMFKATGDDEVIITLDGFERMFSSIVTGEEIDKPLDGWQYLDTYQLNDGDFVHHVFIKWAD